MGKAEEKAGKGSGKRQWKGSGFRQWKRQWKVKERQCVALGLEAREQPKQELDRRPAELEPAEPRVKAVSFEKKGHTASA